MKLSGDNTALLIRMVTHFTAVEVTVDRHSSSMAIKTDTGNSLKQSIMKTSIFSVLSVLVFKSYAS